MKDFIESMYLSFLFDRKTMGFTFFVPIFIFLMVLFLILFVPGDQSDSYNNVILIQGSFIPFSCWWIMYRLSEMYEEGAQDTLVPYYTKRFRIDFLRYYFLNAVGILVLCTVLVSKNGWDALNLINFIHFFLLLLFFMLLGTLLIVWIKNIELALTVVLIFTVLEVATLGEYMPWPHIFLFEYPLWDSILAGKFIILSAAIVVLAILTAILLKRTDRKAV